MLYKMNFLLVCIAISEYIQILCACLSINSFHVLLFEIKYTVLFKPGDTAAAKAPKFRSSKDLEGTRIYILHLNQM